MKLFRRIFLAIVLPLAVGCLFILPTITSDNGYVAGFVYLPFVLLTVLLGGAFTLVGVIATGVKGRPGLWWLAPGPLLMVGFFSLALFAKYFEIGAYREEPMIPLFPETSNVVVFKKATAESQIENFWQVVMSVSRPDGRGYDSLPGVWTTVRLRPRDGHEIATFSFFPNATEEQKQHVYDRVRSSPIVLELRENVATKEYESTPAPVSTVSDNPRTKRVVVRDENSAY